MTRWSKPAGLLTAVLFLSLLLVASCGAEDAKSWTIDFGIESCQLESTGENPYFVLKPGYRLTLRGSEDGDSVMLIISVIGITETVAGIETRVVEEREKVNGELIEVSRNYFAICPDNGSVFYFGEEVDIYRDGEIVGHEGAWRAGENGAKPGLMMAGLPLLGARYYQEIAPEIAMDRAEIIALDATLKTPAGEFENCLIIEETTPLEPHAQEQKVYAPGIGLIKDGNLLLREYGFIRK